jgi:hypothetical protein
MPAPSPQLPSQLGTVGFGDIVASNPPEMLYSIFAIVVGISVFAYTASRVSVLAADLAGGARKADARAGSCIELGCKL